MVGVGYSVTGYQADQEMKNVFSGTLHVSRAVTLIQTIAGLIGIAYFLYTAQYQYLLFGILFGLFLVNVLHNVGLHRYFSHNSFTTNRGWHIFLCLSSPLICAGSPMGYAIAHRTHHAYSDTDRDPHSPAIGFTNVVMYNWDLTHVNLKFLAHLKDNWIQVSHNWYLLIILLFSGFLALIDPLLVLAYSVSVLFSKTGGAMVNYVCHLPSSVMNYRNHNTKDMSQNNVLAGWVFGEWHNNHHANPGAWNEQNKWWEWDTSAWVIKAIKK